MGSSKQDFWKGHPGLVWSNSQAPDTVYIRAALLRPRFGRLLDIALEFGAERLRLEWQVLLADPLVETERARPAVERIISHIEQGFALAAE